MADPHEFERFFGIKGGAVAELEVRLLEEVRVFGEERKGEGEEEQRLHWYLFILCA